MIKDQEIGVIILAAGSSSRLGYAKQLVKFKNKALLQNVIDHASSLNFASKVLVLGARKEVIEKEIIPQDFELVYNENWEVGMSGSISAGLKRSREISENLKHVLILLSDQPLVNADRMELLIEKHISGNKPATFSEYAGDLGVPAIFSSEVFEDLQKLEGDQGAKKLISEGKLEYETVIFENGNFDVDTAEDVERLKLMENK